MKNKKSQAGIIVLIFFLVITILIVSSIAFYGYKKEWFSSKEKKKEEITIPTITLKIRVLDEKGNSIKSNYYLEANNIRLKEGGLEASWNELSNMPINKSYRICYWTDEYYRGCSIYLRSNSFNNITMLEQFSLKNIKGKINIHPIDKLEKGKEQKLRLNISVINGTLSNLIICTWHSVGIIDVIKPEIGILCNRWLNYTYDIEGNRINLTNNLYWCESENKIENCQKIIDKTQCISPNIAPPSRLKDSVDFCYYTGQSIQDSDYIAEYDAKTMEFIDPLDYINFYIIDKELVKIGNEHNLEHTDAEGNDAGIADILYRLNYTY